MTIDQEEQKIRIKRAIAWVCATVALVALVLDVGVTRYSFPLVGFEMAMAVAGMAAIVGMLAGLTSAVVVVQLLLRRRSREILLLLVGMSALVVFAIEFVKFFFE